MKMGNGRSGCSLPPLFHSTSRYVLLVLRLMEQVQARQPGLMERELLELGWWYP